MTRNRVSSWKNLFFYWFLSFSAFPFSFLFIRVKCLVSKQFQKVVKQLQSTFWMDTSTRSSLQLGNRYDAVVKKIVKQFQNGHKTFLKQLWTCWKTIVELLFSSFTTQFISIWNFTYLKFYLGLIEFNLDGEKESHTKKPRPSRLHNIGKHISSLKSFLKVIFGR